jgi:hypothetical protein
VVGTGVGVAGTGDAVGGGVGGSVGAAVAAAPEQPAMDRATRTTDTRERDSIFHPFALVKQAMAL